MLSFSSSAARRWTASSVSSSLNRRGAAAQFRPGGRCQTELLAAVDAILPAPDVGRLVTDPEIACHLFNLRPDTTKSRTRRLNSDGYSLRTVLLSEYLRDLQLCDSNKPRADQASINPSAVQLSS